MTATPPEKRILDLLEADAGVAAIVGTDIYTPNFPAAPTLPGIAFFVQTGNSLSTIGLRNVSIQTHCYGDPENATVGGSEDARNLHEAVRTAFLGDFTDQVAHHALLGTFDISLIEEEQEGQPLPFDPDGPDKGTPVMLGFWTVWFLD